MRHFDVNVKGPIFLTKAVEPYLPKGGRIVFISSAGARLGVAGQTVYAATKAADEALVRVWAKELGQSHGITVNCVNPGPIATGTYAKRGYIPDLGISHWKYHADSMYHSLYRSMVPK
jgi:NAD(P)-dependent dehydrogenase (short-subunit alcohol dehydrogenase family)